MQEYVIITDSSCDLPAEMADAMEIRILPLLVSIDGREYRNYLDERELNTAGFYDELRAGKLAVTSAANADMFLTMMTPYLESGVDVLYIAFSSALSGTYQNALIAAAELREKFKDRTVCCLNSRCASLGQGLLITLAAKARDEGKSLPELKEYIEQMIPRIHHWFTVDDLHFLKRGGRISAATASVGSLLHIKPILHVDEEGRLIPMAKVRGRKAAIRDLLQRITELSVEIGNQTVMISHADCAEDAQALADMIREKLEPAQIVINPIGPVIGAHTGPGTMALFFLGSRR
jgi:DegV family protein with EDD domain